MAQLFEFQKVKIGPRTLVATVEVAPSAPLTTSEDLEATERVINLMPDLCNHLCLGDSAPSFGEVVQDTEIAHLLEHAAVELLAESNIAGDVTCGQTVQVAERTFEITLGCPDDVLVTGALSSAAWILQWAFSGGGDPQPDVPAIVDGLVALVESVSVPAEEPAAEQSVAPYDMATEETFTAEQGGDTAAEQAVPFDPEQYEGYERAVDPGAEPGAAEQEPETAEFAGAYAQDEQGAQPAEEAQADELPAQPAPPEAAVSAPDLDPASTTTATSSAWDFDDVPRPHLVR